MSVKLGPTSVRLNPLGGLGEIGTNCLALEQDDGIIVIDCGTSFPRDDLGVDVLHADFSWLTARSRRVSGVFLTHAHEDHVGAVPHLLKRLDVPVWGPPHALAMVRRRLAEHDLSEEDVDLRLAVAGTVHEVGPFVVEPIRVSHSIVEASALRIETRAGTVVHSGDFNFDPDPPDGEPTDEARLCALAESGVALLLSDSTNIDVAERPGSERSVGVALERHIAPATGRVFVAMFASNIQRLMLLGESAQRVGRKICLLGRSLCTQVEVATEIGRLRWPSNLRVAPEQAAAMPPQELLVLAGGSQAETHSALARLARSAHHQLTVEAGDTVILSSRIIPGNERPVHDMICDLLRLGARVVTRSTDPEVHTSGHAGRSEQRRMIELLQPRAFVPVHGTLHHLLRHAELARECGVGDVVVVENGTSVRFGDDGLYADVTFPVGHVPVAIGGEPLDRETLARRLELGRNGIVHVSLVFNGGRTIVAGPTVTAQGVPGLDQDERALASVARGVVDQLARLRRVDPRDSRLVEDLRRAARRQVFSLCGYRPVVDVTVLEAGE